MNKINWGIAAPGHIAESFAKALVSDPDSICKAVGSRALLKAQTFAEKWKFEKAFGSYKELFSDPDIDIVYIASPHFNHAELSIQAMEAGKAVLCEKPAAVNAADFRKIMECSAKTGRFFMEAWWTAFNPSIRKTFAIIKSGKIGKLKHIAANFCFANIPDPQSRLFNPSIGGGALLDVGIYPIGFAMRAAAAGILPGKNVLSPTVIQSIARLGKASLSDAMAIDYWNSASFLFTEKQASPDSTAAENCVSALLTSSIDSAYMPHSSDAIVYGTTGTLFIKDFWAAQNIVLYDKNGKQTEMLNFPFRINGFEYEIEETVKCLKLGKRESDLNMQADTLAVIETMDALRNLWNMKYPFEEDKERTEIKEPLSPVNNHEISGEEIVIYTDGGCSGNPGPGGWGVVILVDREEKKLSGGECRTTNNRMELTAAVRALEAVIQNDAWKRRPVAIYSDSRYVKNGITSWIVNWKKNGWKTSDKNPVKNQDLWIELDRIYTEIHTISAINWKWVKGHAGIKYNEICDELCRIEIAKFK